MKKYLTPIFMILIFLFATFSVKGSLDKEKLCGSGASECIFKYFPI